MSLLNDFVFPVESKDSVVLAPFCNRVLTECKMYGIRGNTGVMSLQSEIKIK